MIGFKFLILGKKNKPINHGTIAEKLTEGKYLCQFQRIPTSCRVVDILEIEGWNLFPDEDSMNKFISALQEKPPADPPKDPKGKTSGKKSKKAKKKNGK